MELRFAKKRKESSIPLVTADNKLPTLLLFHSVQWSTGTEGKVVTGTAVLTQKLSGGNGLMSTGFMSSLLPQIQTCLIGISFSCSNNLQQIYVF